MKKKRKYIYLEKCLIICILQICIFSFYDFLFFISLSNTISSNIMDKEDILCIIKECACSLAEKELIDKYGKLPEQLMTQNGTYRIKYQDEFNKQYDKYESLLVRLSGKNVNELFP